MSFFSKPIRKTVLKVNVNALEWSNVALSTSKNFNIIATEVGYGDYSSIVSFVLNPIKKEFERLKSMKIVELVDIETRVLASEGELVFIISYREMNVKNTYVKFIKSETTFGYDITMTLVTNIEYKFNQSISENAANGLKDMPDMIKVQNLEKSTDIEYSYTSARFAFCE